MIDRETEVLAPSPGLAREAISEEVRCRRRRLGAVLEAEGVDAVIVASEANCQYLTGYETTFWGNASKPFVVLFAPGASEAVVVCHAGEAPSVELDAVDVRVRTYGAPVDIGDRGVQLDYHGPAVEQVLHGVRELGASVTALELSWHFRAGFTPRAFDALRAGLPDVRDAANALWSVRRRKSDWEIEQMRLAAGVAAEAHRAFAELARPGMTERELNRLLIRSSYDAGAEKIGYTGIVAGVDRAPLGGPTDRRWEPGQLLMADICLQVNGYFADFNRVLANARPSGGQAAAYAQIVEALARARAATAAGARVGDVAEAITGGGASLYDRVGHGLGLEMPEPPSLATVDTTALAAGEVICLEPNVHVPGVGWLVSEEEVVVTDDGFELLSPPFPEAIPQVGC